MTNPDPTLRERAEQATDVVQRYQNECHAGRNFRRHELVALVGAELQSAQDAATASMQAAVTQAAQEIRRLEKHIEELRVEALGWQARYEEGLAFNREQVIRTDAAEDALDEARDAATAAERQRSKAVREAAREYLEYLNSDSPLASDEFSNLKARVITLACNLAEAIEQEP